jgi:hypothetical protein
MALTLRANASHCSKLLLTILYSQPFMALTLRANASYCSKLLQAILYGNLLPVGFIVKAGFE